LNAFEEETGVAVEFVVSFQTVTDRNLVGRIVQTSPGAGAPVTHGQSVVMIVGKFIADD
jgi:beta-lactam-binding protein with PASTA domain